MPPEGGSLHDIAKPTPHPASLSQGYRGLGGKQNSYFYFSTAGPVHMWVAKELYTFSECPCAWGLCAQWRVPVGGSPAFLQELAVA